MLYFIIPYVLVSILNVIFLVKGNTKGKFFTKPLLIPLLLLFYLLNVTSPNNYIIIALICCMLGDIFLLWPEKQACVLAGITSFLTGHIFYIITFINGTNFPTWFFVFLLPYIILELIIARKLFPSMKELKIPSTIYMSILLIMSFTSLTRVWVVSLDSFLLTFIGSLFFIISDIILAFDIFVKHKQSYEVYIMSTYILAQLLIILGFIV